MVTHISEHSSVKDAMRTINVMELLKRRLEKMRVALTESYDKADKETAESLNGVTKELVRIVMIAKNVQKTAGDSIEKFTIDNPALIQQFRIELESDEILQAGVHGAMMDELDLLINILKNKGQ